MSIRAVAIPEYISSALLAKHSFTFLYPQASAQAAAERLNRKTPSTANYAPAPPDAPPAAPAHVEMMVCSEYAA